MTSKNAKKSNAESQAASGDAQATGMPLFFKNPKVISMDRHSQAKLRAGITMGFASHTNSIPLTVGDVMECAKHYPVVFTQGDNSAPVAIVGFEQDNYFVDDKGNWLEDAYIPGYARKYPFVFLEMPESDQLTLCIDEDAVTFDMEADGHALYDQDKPSAFTESALSFCANFQEQHRVTKLFSEKLKELGLLTPQRSNVELSSKRTMQLNGFQAIDIEKFRALSKDQVVSLYEGGFLALIYYVIQSQSNWQRLLNMANRREV